MDRYMRLHFDVKTSSVKQKTVKSSVEDLWSQS